jgi:hypothetical protein
MSFLGTWGHFVRQFCAKLRYKNLVRLFPVVIVAIVLVLILSIPVPPGQSRFIVDVLDAGHAPLFGVAALLLLRTAPRERRGTPRQYLFVLLVAALIGILTELAQRAEGGDAEMNDVVADILGAASFLAIHWTLAHRAAAFRWFLRFAAIAGLLAVFMPAILSGMATLHYYTAFPVLLDFQSIWDSRWCRSDGAKFDIVPAPPGTGKPGSDRMGRITFEPYDVSAFIIEGSYPDWKGYRQFAFTVYSELPTDAPLILRIADKRDKNHFSESFETHLTIAPGINKIRIPLAALEAAPGGRRMDMTAIHRIILLAVHSQSRFPVYVDDFHLE